MRLSWDELDELGCIDDGAPNWNSMTVVGPTKIRDSRGQVTLQWSVTVHCGPAAPVAALPVPDSPSIAEFDSSEPPPPVGAVA